MKKCFIILSILMIFSLVSCATPQETSKPAEKNNDNNFIKGDEVKGEVKEIDTSMITMLMEKGYTLEQASEIQKILNTLGITSIEIEVMTGENAQDLNAVICYPNGLTERNRRFNFTTENGIVFYAGFLGDDLYDTERGGFLKKYDDVYVAETKVDMEIFDELQLLAQDAVNGYLTNSSTAHFSLFDWRAGRSDDNYKLQGSVTAKNSFGVEKDMVFAVWFIKSGNGFMVEAVTIDAVRVK